MPQLLRFVVLALLVRPLPCDCDWDIVDGSSLSFKQFAKRHWEQKPVVFTNLISDWPIIQDPDQIDEFIDAVGAVQIQSTIITPSGRTGAFEHQGTNLSKFWHGPKTGENSIFLEPWSFPSRELISRSLLSMPEALKGLHKNGPFVSIARESHSNAMHKHAQNWFAQVFGRKRWYAIAPDDDAAYLGAVQDVCNDERLTALKSCNLSAGQVLYLPSNYYHGTCALTDQTLGIAFIGSDFKQKARADWVDLSLHAKFGHLSELPSKIPAKALPHVTRSAVSGGHLAVLDYLVGNGAELQTGRDGPLLLAVEHGHVDVARFIMIHTNFQPRDEEREQISLLHRAAAAGHSEMVDIFALLGMDVLAKSPTGMTPAMFAAGKGHVMMLEHLVAKYRLPLDDVQKCFQAAAMQSMDYVIHHFNSKYGIGVNEIHELCKKAGWQRCAESLEPLLRREKVTGKHTISMESASEL